MRLSQYLYALSAILLLETSCVYAQTFTDVGPNQLHFQAINSLVNLGVVEGYTDGNFKPQNPISRAEAVKILIETIKPAWAIEDTQRELISGNSYSPFYDVKEKDWFAPYVVLPRRVCGWI